MTFPVKLNLDAPRNLWKEHKKTIVPSMLVGILAVVAYIIWGSTPYAYLVNKAQGQAEFALDKVQMHVMGGDQVKDYNATVEQASDMQKHISTEIDTLSHLYTKRDALKNSWGWFLNYDKLHEVDLVQMEINDQRRIIRNEIEDMNLLRKTLKRQHGIVSKAFLKDTVFSLGEVLSRLHVLFPPLGFSLLSFLLLGPAVAAGCLLFVALGMTLVPLFICSSLVLWLLHFPTVLLQYDPTFLQFFFCYGASTSFVLASVYGILYGAGANEQLFALPAPSTFKARLERWRQHVHPIPIEGGDAPVEPAAEMPSDGPAQSSAVREEPATPDAADADMDPTRE